LRRPPRVVAQEADGFQCSRSGLTNSQSDF
jgi:hypothetical protein